MEIEIAMDRQLVAQHALIIYGYEKDPRYEEPANSIDHYVTKHRIDGEGRLLEGAPLTREVLHKICSLVIPSLQTMEYIPEKVIAYSPGHSDSLVDPRGREAHLLHEGNRIEIGRLSAAGDAVPCRQPDAPHMGPCHGSEARARAPLSITAPSSTSTKAGRAAWGTSSFPGTRRRETSASGKRHSSTAPATATSRRSCKG